MNIQLNYLYRDCTNYKQYNYEVYTNSSNLSVSEIEERIAKQLIDGEWFYCHNWDLKDLHHFTWDNKVDHTWHEYEEVEETTNPATKGDIADLLKQVESVVKYSL